MQLTESKIKEFIQRCYDEKDYNKQSLINDINLRLHRGRLSCLPCAIWAKKFTLKSGYFPDR